ncbi:hypothetical protein J4V27_25530, partial [Escherichia coli]
ILIKNISTLYKNKNKKPPPIQLTDLGWFFPSQNAKGEHPKYVFYPIRIDRPKVNTITMKAYQPGNAPSKTSNKASGSAPYSERKHKATPRQGNIFKRFTALMFYFIRYKFI